MIKRRLKLGLKRPELCLFWSLPCLDALGIDIFIWQNGGSGFHFSDTGYLLEHYAPEAYIEIAAASDMPFYLQALNAIFHTKTVIAGAVLSLIPILYINRPRRGSDRLSSRRKHR